MSYIILRGHWFHIIILNFHAPAEDKIDMKDSFYDELECIFDKFPKCHTKILLVDFSAKIDREDIFKPTVGNESLHEISNDNGARVVNVATTKKFIVKSVMFTNDNVHKYNWTSPDGKTYNQIDHILIDRRRRHSSMFDAQSFRAVDCNMDHDLAVAKIRVRLAVNKEHTDFIWRGSVFGS
jgi:hypothetical protein